MNEDKTEAMQDAVEDAAETVTDAAEDAAEAVEETVDDTAGKADETADDFRWDMVNPVRQGDMIYSRVIFSYVSSLPGAMKPRVLMESVSMMRLKDGLIQEYTEVVNNGPSLVECGLPPEHVAKILNRQGQKLRNKPEAQRHLA